MSKRSAVVIFVASVCAVGQSAGAQSREASARTPAPAKQSLPFPSLNGSWRSRIYVGASLGSGWTRFDVTGPSDFGVSQITNQNVPGRGVVIVPGTTGTFAAASTAWKGSGVGGITVGYPIHSGSLEWAAEADLNASSASGSIRQGVMMPATALQTEYPLFMQRTFHSSWDGSLRARAGKYWGRTMLYGTAGIAAMHVTVDARDSTSSGSVTSQISVQIPTLAWVPSRTVSSGSHLHPGFTIGGGAQRAVTPRIDVAIEYRYSAFASHKYQNCTTDTTVVFASTQFVEHRTSCASLVGGASPQPGAPADIIQSAANVIRPSRAQLIARVLFKQPWW